LNIRIEGVSSEALMLSSKEYCGVSNGSACTSSSYAPSYVLVAMGMSDEEIDQSIRLSWGRNTNMGSLRNDFGRLLDVVKGLV
jgi:cysteine desulfurase